jgi:OmpA-OmpF porin, OOP family
MATFDVLIDDLASRFGLGANSRVLVREVLAMIAGTPGGLGSFLAKLKTRGLTWEIGSWLGRPQATALSAQQIERALGSPALGGLASRVGLTQGVVATATGYALPKIVGLLTPGGVVPDGVPAEITKFLSPAPAAVVPPRGVDAPPSRTPEPSGVARWLWPALAALVVVGLLSYFWSTLNRMPSGTPVANAPEPAPPAPPPATEAQQAQLAPAPAPAPPAPPPATEAQQAQSAPPPATEAQQTPPAPAPATEAQQQPTPPPATEAQQAPPAPPPATEAQQAPPAPPPATEAQQAPPAPPPATEAEQTPPTPPPATEAQQTPPAPPPATEAQQAPPAPSPGTETQQPPAPPATTEARQTPAAAAPAPATAETAATPAPATVAAAEPNAPASAATPARLALSNENGAVRASGSVPDDDSKTSILNALNDVFGADNVKSDISVSQNAGAAPWLGAFRAALDALKGANVDALFVGDQVNVGGAAIEDAARDKIIEALKSALGADVAVGALSDKTAAAIAIANDRATSELASLQSGFDVKDLLFALNDSVVTFASDSAEVPESMAPFLKIAASELKQLKAGNVLEIAGYTDNTGDAALNLALSQKRADAVREALITYGADPDMLIAKGYGETDPVASNDTAEGRLKNRRIEYHVVKAPG